MIRGIGPFILGTLLFVLTGCDQFSARVAANKGYQAYSAAMAAASSTDPDIAATAPALYEEAINNYEEARASLPKNNVIIRNLAFAYLAASHLPTAKENAKKSTDKAIELLTDRVTNNPKDIKLMEVLLDAWERNNRLVDATVFFEGRLQKNPNDLNSLNALESIQLKRGNFPAAIDLLERRKKLTPNDGQVYLSLAATCWQWLRAGVVAEPGPEAVEAQGYTAAVEANKRLPKSESPLVYGEQVLVERAKREKNSRRETFRNTIDILEKHKQITPNEAQIYIRIAENSLKWLQVQAPKDNDGTAQVATQGYEAAVKAGQIDSKLLAQTDNYAGRLLKWRASARRESDPAEAAKDEKRADELLNEAKVPDPSKAGHNAKP
jgi:tetratricopeptide (TPR) repeat protein